MSEGWMKPVNELLENMKRVNGKVPSERTKTMTRDVMYASFRLLHRLGYKIVEPKNLADRHIRVLVQHWWHEQKKAPKTIENDLSRLRVFCKLLGKPGMVKRARDYLPEVDAKALVVSSIAKESKSWSGKGVDATQLFNEADAIDVRFGLMLRLQLAFGLRQNEALKCNPHRQDKGAYLEIPPGHGKGGRPRTIWILHDAQRQLLDLVKEHSKKNEPLGWTETARGQTATLEQNEKRYYNLSSKLGLTRSGKYGVTVHGLRAQFAENQSLWAGLLPPILGGTKGQMDKEELKLKVSQLSDAMGHNRTRVMGAYYGAFGHQPQVDEAVSHMQMIESAAARLGKKLPDVPIERRADCRYIQGAMDDVYCYLSIEAIHLLWQRWSRRCGRTWLMPDGHVALALASAAQEVMKHASPADMPTQRAGAEVVGEPVR